MKIKEGVKIEGLHIKMRPVLIACERIWKENGQELVVTSGLNGIHSAGSLHYYGRAVDLRTRYFDSRERIDRIAEMVRTELGQDYDVVVENSHIHAEWDKKGV